MADAPPISPLAPAQFPDLPEIAGLELATAAAGIKYQGRDDVMLARLCPGTAIAGVFTLSATRSAPVLDCQEKLGGEPIDGAAILVNSGNSNAFTGGAGRASVDAICATVAAACEVPEKRVFTASTGVIGERLPDNRITGKVAALVAELGNGAIKASASAICTTDTFPKGAFADLQTPDGPITIMGFAKGSGMIAPDMATMLVYIFTDATIPQADLQTALSKGVKTTFNAITVDSDTSTSDTLILAATQQGPPVNAAEFEPALNKVMRDLAHQVVRDGEGATKFVEVQVSGADSDADAKRVAMAIANSPLVKTAIAGEDPNWGRIVMAVGKSGALADRDRLTIRFGDAIVAEDGWASPNYSEEIGVAHMKGTEIVIKVDLGIGTGQFTAWTCDLTHGYISINADYRS